MSHSGGTDTSTRRSVGQRTEGGVSGEAWKDMWNPKGASLGNERGGHKRSQGRLQKGPGEADKKKPGEAEKRSQGRLTGRARRG